MRIIDLLHRWTGGLIGLLLAVLGLSGAILVFRDQWNFLPHARDTQIRDVGVISDAVGRIMADPAARPESILFASKDLGLHRLRFEGDAGAYTDQAGEQITRWASKWDRVELWLFDFHHYLWSGKTGAIIEGWLALIGIGFVVTGLILWWPLRKTFSLRAWPARMSRPAIVRHHRDLGAVVAPLLLISCLTGAMLTLKPVAGFLLSPWSSPKEIVKSLEAPETKGGPLAGNPDWRAMLTAAHQRFPQAEFRGLGLPDKAGELITLRMKQPEEWLPNGRTMVWFDPATGRIVEARDALAMPRGAQLFNLLYPLHAAKVGGLAYKLLMTVSGLSLAMLGSLTVWSFWFRRPRKRAAGRVPARPTVNA